MSQRDAILSQIIEFANDSWRIYFDKIEDGYKVQFTQRFDSYTASASFLESLRETFKADRVSVNFNERDVVICILGVPNKYFDPAFEKIAARKDDEVQDRDE